MAKTAVQKAPEATDERLAPVKVFRIEDVSASVFARERVLKGEPVTFYSVSLSRSYKAADGQRKFVKSFDGEDLGKLASLIQQASEFIQFQLEASAA